ncbi:hypothetical protein C8034_v003923 [Colletotrichum sidae]|uniref:Uncharacterized protein n=1 Tax=Colletotrichum sidae TaxID=1347389 RepID=A0A4R8TQL4_9PEZI|nr:hypothetical protein C8034_v003923 [Colletotrichum sidae]
MAVEVTAQAPAESARQTGRKVYRSPEDLSDEEKKRLTTVWRTLFQAMPYNLRSFTKAKAAIMRMVFMGWDSTQEPGVRAASKELPPTDLKFKIGVLGAEVDGKHGRRKDNNIFLAIEDIRMIQFSDATPGVPLMGPVSPLLAWYKLTDADGNAAPSDETIMDNVDDDGDPLRTLCINLLETLDKKQAALVKHFIRFNYLWAVGQIREEISAWKTGGGILASRVFGPDDLVKGNPCTSKTILIFLPHPDHSDADDMVSVNILGARDSAGARWTWLSADDTIIKYCFGDNED